jgi:hypothetical protein
VKDNFGDHHVDVRTEQMIKNKTGFISFGINNSGGLL